RERVKYGSTGRSGQANKPRHQVGRFDGWVVIGDLSTVIKSAIFEFPTVKIPRFFWFQRNLLAPPVAITVFLARLFREFQRSDVEILRIELIVFQSNTVGGEASFPIIYAFRRTILSVYVILSIPIFARLAPIISCSRFSNPTPIYINRARAVLLYIVRDRSF